MTLAFKNCFLFFWVMLASVTTSAQFPAVDMVGANKSVIIPFKYMQGMMIVEVTVEGKSTLNFIFDTGSEETTFFEMNIASLLGWEMNETIKIVGSDMKTTLDAKIARNINMSLTKGEQFTQDIIVLDNSLIPFENILGVPVSGILGGSFLRGATLEINYKRKFIKFYHPQFPPENTEDYKEVALNIKNNRPYLDSKLSVIRGDTSQIELLLDTGAAIHLLINHNTIPTLEIRDDIENSYLASGLGGYLGGYVGFVQFVSFANVEYSDFPVYFQKLDSLLLQDSIIQKRNGIIGNILLKNHIVVLDFLRHKAYVETKKVKKQDFRINKSGMTVFQVGVDKNEFYVHQIHSNSVAYQAGIREGDYILNLNYCPKGFMSMDYVNNKLSGKPGKRIRIKVKRNDGKMVYKFLLASIKG